ncbi:DUF4115 domain-containing protein [Gammaproteobacteria bacterium]|nr:DUF4115 domain-containing protein [Gammaproteobacteria bacterium]
MSEENQDIESVADDESTMDLSDLPSPGQILKTMREEKGLSHARVAQALHMTAHYVNALESNQFDKLPGKTFVKGYFKAYAKLLGADIEHITTCYDQYMAKLEETEISEANVIRARRAYDQNLRWMICAALIIIVVIGVSWWLAISVDSQASVNSANGNEQLAEIRTEINVSDTAMFEAGSESEIMTAVMSSTRVGNQNSQEELSAAVSINESVTAEVLVARINEIGNEAQADVGAKGSGNKSKSLTLLPSVRDTDTERPADAGTDILLDTLADMESETQAIPAATLPNQQRPVIAENFLRDNPADSDALEQALAEPVSELPEYNVTRVDNHRSVSLESDGDDLLEVHFLGDSWVEVDNSNSTRLYNDMLGVGDDLTIKGSAPFNVLFGDANVVEVIFNAAQVDLSARIRSDNSARVILQSEN